MKKDSEGGFRKEPDFRSGVRGKYAARYREGPIVVREVPVSVFLAHDRRDRVAARGIAARLREHGVRVWLEEGEVGPAESLRARLAPLAGEAEFVAVALSRAAIDSPWVQAELPALLEEELAAHQVPVVSLLLEPVEIPAFLAGKFTGDFTAPDCAEAALARLLVGMGVVDDDEEAVERRQARKPSAA